MDILSLPTELFELICDILKNNIIYIVSFAYVNKYLYKMISNYATNKLIERKPDCKYAVLTNRIEILKWAIDISLPLNSDSCVVSAIKGNIDMLQFLLIDKSDSSLWNKLNGSLWNDKIIIKAAQCGQIDVVKWILDNFDNDDYPCMKFKSSDNELLSLCGYDDIIKHEDNLSLVYACSKIKYNELTLCACAAQSGNLELVQFLKEHKFLFDFHVHHRAALGGHIHVLKWLKEQFCMFDIDTVIHATINGDIEVLEWFKNNECPIVHHNIATTAIRIDSICTLQWLIDNGYQCITHNIYYAALYGKKDVIKWLRKKGCPWNYSACSAAAVGNCLSLLKWLRKKDCPWNSLTCECALYHKHIELFNWAKENGCPYP